MSVFELNKIVQTANIKTKQPYLQNDEARYTMQTLQCTALS